jgi:Polyketide cyclase / dehydrase and lipid transport
MATITVSKQLAVSADALWAMLADFGNVSWIPGVSGVRVEGQGPGMSRMISGSSGDPIVETLLWIKPDGRALAYEIKNNPLPVSRFQAVVTVTEHDGIDGRACNPASGPTSLATWDVDYDPEGDDAAARDGRLARGRHCRRRP